MIKQDNILRFEKFSQFEFLTHGFSTKTFGNLRISDPDYSQHLEDFIQKLGINTDQIVRMNQVHSGTVYFAEEKDKGVTIQETDGLLTQTTNIFLGVITADCIPFLLYDPKTKTVGAVHAGWRGLFSEIIKVAVAEMIEKGSKPEDIFVGIGPSIRVCCYEVGEDFVERFREQFGDVERFINRRNGKIFFNLQKVAKEQLNSVGILQENIEDADYCTFDHDDVHSYRREKEKDGRILGIIGIQNENK